MVTRAGGYHREPLHGERGVTQGEPLSPTIFNVVVDEVVRYWDSLVAERAGGDNSKDDSSQPEGRKIRARKMDEGGQRREEGHTWLKVKSAFSTGTTEWWPPPT